MFTSLRRLTGAILLTLGLACGSAYGAAWTKAEGEAFLKLGTSMLRADEFYEGNGSRLTIPTLSEYTLSLYGEYGLTDDFTVIAYLPFVTRVTVNEQVGRPSGFVYTAGAENTQLGDVDLGLRYGIVQEGATVLSAGLLLGLPLGDDDNDNALFTGDGEFNQLVSLALGHSFYPTALYAIAQLGVNMRSGGFSDELRYSVELGYTAWEALTLIGRLSAVQSLKNGDAAGGMAGLHVNDQQYLSPGLELAYKLTESLGVSLGFASATNAENVLAAPRYEFGVYTTLP